MDSERTIALYDGANYHMRCQPIHSCNGNVQLTGVGQVQEVEHDHAAESDVQRTTWEVERHPDRQDEEAGQKSLNNVGCVVLRNQNPVQLTKEHEPHENADERASGKIVWLHI